jgi:hypothetical protein
MKIAGNGWRQIERRSIFGGTLDEYATIEETMSPAALEIMADWITRHSREGRK